MEPSSTTQDQQIQGDGSTFGEGGATLHAYSRPRRPESETLTYLRSLEPVIDKSITALLQQNSNQRGTIVNDAQKRYQEVEEEENEAEERSLLVQNLIDELTFKVASLAMDRHAAPTLEKVARLCTRKQLAHLLHGCLGYAACLASNRYSSHVLQTFLSLTGPMLEAELLGIGEEEDRDEGLDDKPPFSTGSEIDEAAPGEGISLADTATKLAEELRASWLSLIFDLCGTHSMRAFFCLLAGMPAVAEKRGRHAKHKHGIETAVAVGYQGIGAGPGDVRSKTQGETGNLHSTPLVMHRVPARLADILGEMVTELANMELRDLHQALCDPYASPALGLLVQAVARKESAVRQDFHLDTDGIFFKQLVAKALCFKDADRCAEVVYAMAGEIMSSRFLEAVLWHTAPTQVAARIFEACIRGRVMEFAEDSVANFVLQTWLQRTESPEHLKAALDELAPRVRRLVETRRAGVLWRLAGACLRLRHGQEEMVDAVVSGLGGAGGETKKEEGTNSSRLDMAVLALQTGLELDVGQGHREEGHGTEHDRRLHLNVPGARLFECLMRFPTSSGKHRGSGWIICRAVLELPPETLVAVATDNIGSRTLLDPLLGASSAGTELGAATIERRERSEGGGRTAENRGEKSKKRKTSDPHRDEINSSLADRLAQRLQGHYASLAAHPVGFHILTKCFSSSGLSLEWKKNVVQELIDAESRLAGGHFGRRALREVGVSLYRVNQAKWEEAQKEGERKKEVLDDLLDMLEHEAEVAGKGRGASQRNGKMHGATKNRKEDVEKTSKRRREDNTEQQQLEPDSQNHSVFDLLMGASKYMAKSKERRGPDEQAEGAARDSKSLEFVLEATKTPCKSDTNIAVPSESKSKRVHKKRQSESGRSEKQERATRRQGNLQHAKNESSAPSATKSLFKSSRQDGGLKKNHLANKTAVEKAQVILGNRAMMSRRELFSAVEGLEQEIKKEKHASDKQAGRRHV